MGQYWCQFCEIFVYDSKFSRAQHEKSTKHQRSLERALKTAQNKKRDAEKIAKGELDTLRQMEIAAGLLPDLTKMESNGIGANTTTHATTHATTHTSANKNKNSHTIRNAHTHTILSSNGRINKNNIPKQNIKTSVKLSKEALREENKKQLASLGVYETPQDQALPGEWTVVDPSESVLKPKLYSGSNNDNNNYNDILNQTNTSGSLVDQRENARKNEFRNWNFEEKSSTKNILNDNKIDAELKSETKNKVVLSFKKRKKASTGSRKFL